MKRLVSGIILTLLVSSMLTLAFDIQPVKAEGTIYIRADGSIDPPTAPIQRNGDVYTLIANINSDADGIVIERNNMILDGEGYTVQGLGWPYIGIYMSGRTNVTIMNVEVKAFHHGISLSGSSNSSIVRNNMAENYYGILLSASSNYNSIVANNVTNNGLGIWFAFSSDNNVEGNNIANSHIGVEVYPSSNHNSIFANNIANNDWGILLSQSSNNSISRNNIANSSEHGIIVSESSNYHIYENNITNNRSGISIDYSSDQYIYHNNFVNNVRQAYTVVSVNVWDDGYPSGGNYWSDYAGVDLYSGPYQNETGSDGIGDALCVIDSSNQDNYPLMRPYVPFENQTIYIRADGSVDPSGAPIHRAGDLYTLTDNITSNAHGIVIERSNMTSDGANYTVQGSGAWASIGVSIFESDNVTIKNMGITAFYHGIQLELSSNDSMSENNIADNFIGIWLERRSNNNSFSGNNITNSAEGVILFGSHSNIYVGNNMKNNNIGIRLDYSNNNSISGNNIAANSWDGIRIHKSSNNSIVGNNIRENKVIGIHLMESSNNIFDHNNFIDNTIQASLTQSFNNTCNDGYPSGGNYWSDYAGVDFFSGQYQNETGSDGIVDTPYIIDANNTDHYPLVKPYPWGPSDVGVTYIGRVRYPDIVAFRTFIWRGFTLRFDTFVMNYGNSSENLNVTAYANDTVIDQRFNVTLEEHNSTILTLEWNSTGFPIGFYNITVYVEPVQGETEITDNARSVWMFVYIVGDLNGDGKVDMRDIATVAKAFGQTVPPISPDLDVNEDWKIDMRDIGTVARHFGEHYP